jgi:hypothetical protein
MMGDVFLELLPSICRRSASFLRIVTPAHMFISGNTYGIKIGNSEGVERGFLPVCVQQSQLFGTASLHKFNLG